MNFDENNLKKDINKKIDEVFSVLHSVASGRDKLIKTASKEDLNKPVSVNNENMHVSTSYNQVIASKDEDDNKLEEKRIMIVSKEIKDPAYEMYMTKVAITQNGEKIYMVSFFLRELYLGRYLINRNLYFLKGNHSEAKKAYKDFIDKSEEVRNTYYAEGLPSIRIPIELQNFAIGQTGDFDFKDECQLGTTVQRKHFNESTVYEWFRSNEQTMKEQRKHFDSVEGE